MFLKTFLRRIPAWVEFVIVTGLCWGLPAFRSAAIALGLTQMHPFDNGFALKAVSYELVAGSSAYAFLRVRGWSRRDFPIEVNWDTTGAGFLLLLLTYLLHWTALYIGLVLGGSLEPLEEMARSISMALPVAVMFSTVHGAFEELFLVGYVFRSLEAQGLAFVLGVSVFLRMLTHIYQGPAAALSILFMGILFGLVYARYRQLWPLIFAHFSIDFISLSQ